MMNCRQGICMNKTDTLMIKRKGRGDWGVEISGLGRGDFKTY